MTKRTPVLGARRRHSLLLACATCAASLALASTVGAETAKSAAEAAASKALAGSPPASAAPAASAPAAVVKPAAPAAPAAPVPTVPTAPAAPTPPAPTAPVPAASTPPAAPTPPAAAVPTGKPSVLKPAAAKAATAPKPAEPAPAPTAASSAEAEAVWKAYEKRWSETADYAAQFRQTIEVPDIGSRVESAGRFYFQKPGLVRWEYTEGPPQTVVGDGKWIWVWQPDLEQVYKIAYAKAFGRGGLVELLAGREGVSERYSATLEKPDASTVKIRLKSLTEAAGDLEVTLAADTFDLRAVAVHDAAGSITQMTFAQPLRNKGVEADRFSFTPPPGVDIISESDAGF